MESAGQVQVLRLSVYFHKNSSRSSAFSRYYDSRVVLFCFFLFIFYKNHSTAPAFFYFFFLKPARFSFERVSLKLRRFPARFFAVLTLLLSYSHSFTHARIHKTRASFLFSTFADFAKMNIAVVMLELKKHALFSFLLFGICNTSRRYDRTNFNFLTKCFTNCLYNVLYLLFFIFLSMI